MAVVGKGSLARKGAAGQGENGLDIGGAVELVEVDDHLLGVGPVEGMGHIGHADKLAGDPKDGLLFAPGGIVVVGGTEDALHQQAVFSRGVGQRSGDGVVDLVVAGHRVGSLGGVDRLRRRVGLFLCSRGMAASGEREGQAEGGEEDSHFFFPLRFFFLYLWPKLNPT